MVMNIQKEWEFDLSLSESEETRDWLDGLAKRTWRLDVVELDRIRLDPKTMDYANPALDYNFRKRLAERKDELRRAMVKFGTVISPLIIRAEDDTLMDGYCRYHVLLDMNVSKTFAYFGTKP